MQGKAGQNIPELPQGHAPKGIEQAEKRDAVFQDNGDETVHTRFQFPFCALDGQKDLKRTLHR